MDQAEKSSLIQQRIKKMMENKRKNADVEHTKRLKSGAGTTGDKLHEAETQEELGKPQSSIRLRRPASAFKAVESGQGVSVAPVQKVQIDVKALLLTVFDHGVKLQQFLKESRLDASKYHDYLSGNELFILSMLSKLKSIPEQKHSVALQKLTMAKISRELNVRAQMERCQQAEQRITQRLEERLRMLSKKS